MKTGLLIFDLDGTLADTVADLATAINLMRRHYSLVPLSRTEIDACIGDGIRQLVERALKKSGIDTDEALGLYRGLYRKHMLDETQLYPGVQNGLKTLTKQGWKLAVLTNKTSDAACQILEHLVNGKPFFRIIGGGDLPDLKPAPAGIFELMQEAGAAPENTWMIGDHHTDLEAAQRAGVHSAFLTYGIGNTGGFTPDHIWNNFDELIEYFSKPGS
ncbi:MAG: HAD-IIIA family hydrolase [Kiritimatiellales bacterium]